MKTTKLSLLLFAIVLIFSIKSLHAQNNYLPGIIVDINGDTIKGFIEYTEWRINPEKINFKPSLEQERKQYKPNDIKAFHFSEFIFRSKEVQVTKMNRNEQNATSQAIPDSKKEQTFLKLIVESKISLYELKDNVDIDHYYIDIPGDTLDELIYFKYIVENNGVRSVNTNTRYKGQLTYYLRDCKDITNVIQKTDYTLPDLAKLVNSYNHCIDEPILYHFNYEESMTRKRKQSRFKIGLYAGVSFTKLNFHGGAGDLPYILNSEFPTSINPAFGLIMNIEPAKARGKWSIIIDLIVRGYSTSSSYLEQISDDWYRNYDVKLGATYITINPMWRYYFLTEKIKPYLNAGLYFGSSVARTNSLETTEYYYGETNYTQSSALGYSGFDFGFTIGGGVFIKKFSIDLRYNYGGFNIYDVGSNLQSFTTMIGYTFN